MICWRIGNQCSCRRNSVVWQNEEVTEALWVTEFCIICSLSRLLADCRAWVRWRSLYRDATMSDHLGDVKCQCCGRICRSARRPMIAAAVYRPNFSNVPVHRQNRLEYHTEWGPSLTAAKRHYCPRSRQCQLPLAIGILLPWTPELSAKTIKLHETGIFSLSGGKIRILRAAMLIIAVRIFIVGW